MSCRFDKDTGTYQTPTGPCTHDDYGDPTHHCTRNRCANHVGQGEFTCPRCIHKTRGSLQQLVDLAALMTYESMARGDVNGEAMNLAAHATDPEAWGHREASAVAGRVAAVDVDPAARKHPEYLLGSWAMVLRDAYNHPDPTTQETASEAAAYLHAHLPRFAQDPILNTDPDTACARLHKELGAAIQHAAQTIRDTHRVDKGAPCPACTTVGIPPERLRYRYGDTEPDDHWYCPTNPDHTMTVDQYSNWINERTTA